MWLAGWWCPLACVCACVYRSSTATPGPPNAQIVFGPANNTMQPKTTTTPTCSAKNGKEKKKRRISRYTGDVSNVAFHSHSMGCIVFVHSCTRSSRSILYYVRVNHIIICLFKSVCACEHVCRPQRHSVSLCVCVCMLLGACTRVHVRVCGFSFVRAGRTRTRARTQFD